jgi:hypothetical protein
MGGGLLSEEEVVLVAVLVAVSEGVLSFVGWLMKVLVLMRAELSVAT